MLLRAVGDPVCTTPLIVAVSFPIETAGIDIFGVVDLNHVTYSNRCRLKPISTLTCIEASYAREDDHVRIEAVVGKRQHKLRDLVEGTTDGPRFAGCKE